ncbi:MAG: hemolysin family protein [Thermoleophilaceae bacterium]
MGSDVARRDPRYNQGMAIELIVAIALVLANGFFVATEFAIARLRPTQVEEFERAGRPGAASVRHAVDHIDAYLAACQLGITVASLGLGVVGEPVFEELFHGVLGDAAPIAGFGLSAALAFALITLLHVVVGELSPKSLAISRTSSTALWVTPPMRLFYLLTKPLVDLFNGLGNLLLKPLGIPPAREAGHAPHSEEELRAIMRDSRGEGLIDRADQELTENVFAFGDRRVREVMTPRGEIDFLTTDDDLRGAIARAIENGHTRLPLGSPAAGLDEPVGMIHAKDLLPASAETDTRPLAALARPLDRVSESALISEVLRELRRRHRHLALVADEHGTTTGLVTLEDVPRSWWARSRTSSTSRMRPASGARAGICSCQGRCHCSTWHVSSASRSKIRTRPRSAAMVEALGRVPEPGETLELNGFRIEVLESDGPLVRALRLRPIP